MENNKNTILFSENVKLTGRTYMMDDTLWCAFSGSGVQFKFSGRYLKITFCADNSLSHGEENFARAAVLVNGERVFDKLISEPEIEAVIFDGVEIIEAEVHIIKLSETAMSTFGIKPLETDADANIAPLPEKQLKIEFIGDSITCGYGVDDNDPEHHFKTSTEDVTKAYAYKTAQSLNADYSMVSISGYGIISGYTDDPDKIIPEQTIPQYYDKLGFSYCSFAEKTAPQDIKWDFGSYVPDLIVINLGTNDESYCKEDAAKQKVYSDAYVEFLKTVRSFNPNAEMLCVLGIMGQGLCKAVKAACEKYTAETGDVRVHCADLSDKRDTLGFGADYHPSPDAHTFASEEAVKAIKAVL